MKYPGGKEILNLKNYRWIIFSAKSRNLTTTPIKSKVLNWVTGGIRSEFLIMIWNLRFLYWRDLPGQPSWIWMGNWWFRKENKIRENFRNRIMKHQTYHDMKSFLRLLEL